MAWSVQIPNPLTVGGNGDIGEIDVLAADGTPVVTIGGSSTGIVVTDGTRSITIDSVGSLAQLLFEVAGADIGQISFDTSQSPPYFKIKGIFNANLYGFLTFAPGNNFVLLGMTNGTITQDAKMYIQPGDITETWRITHFLVYAPTQGDGSNPSETWHAVSYNVPSGWSDFGAGFAGVAYKFMPDGTVRFRGTMQPGTRVDGSVIFNLPAAYRPTAPKQFRPRHDATSANGLVQVQTNGDLLIFGMAGVNAVTMDGMTYDGPSIA